MRTDDEIIEMYKAKSIDDLFGCWIKVLHYVPIEARSRVVTVETVHDLGDTVGDYTRKTILNKILEYMPFAWEKANSCRGLSAARSIDHMAAWVFLLGESEQELFEFIEDPDNYYHYGKPILERICQHFGWDYSEWDNGYRGNSENDQQLVE